MAADWPIYYSNDGLKDSFAVVGEPNKKYFLIVDPVPTTKKANECGQIVVATYQDFKINGVDYDIDAMPIKDPPRCVQGQPTYNSGGPVFDGDYKVVVPGFVPYKPYAVTASHLQVTRKANICGVVVFTGNYGNLITVHSEDWLIDYDLVHTKFVTKEAGPYQAILGQPPICKKGTLFLPQ